MIVKQIYLRFIQFLRTKLTRVQLIILVAAFIGLVSGLIAVLLKTSVHYIQHWATDRDSKFAYLILPAIGLVLTVLLVRYLFGGQLDKGIPLVLKAIARRASFIPLKHTYAHVLTSSVTVGLGGSVGLEAPIVATGSSIGSNISRISEFSYQERTLMIGCGAAAGIAAVFNAPIAGVIFALEVLLVDTILSYFIPLIISSVVGVLCSKIILGDSSMFNFSLQENFDYHNVPFYILLGLLAGFVSLYYAYTFKSTEHRIEAMKINPYGKAALSGLLLLGIYFLLPPLYGEGYNSVKLVANGVYTVNSFSDNTSLFSLLGENWGIILFAALVVLFKPIAAGITIGGGGNGGNFAPSLFVGSYLGFFFSRLINSTPWFKLPVGNFSLVGMAGVLSGVMYCPLSAIFLIAEITNGYGLFIPLMIVSSISFFLVKSYQPFSMDTKKLAKDGLIFTHKKEKNILTSISLADILQDDYDIIHPDQKFSELVELVKRSKRNIFAVVDRKRKFVGIIELNDIKRQIFEPTKHENLSVKNLVKKPAAILQDDLNMHTVMEQFDLTQSWYLPVLDKEKHFLGFVSKTKIFNKYRETLSSQTDLYD